MLELKVCTTTPSHGNNVNYIRILNCHKASLGNMSPSLQERQGIEDSYTVPCKQLPGAGIFGPSCDPLGSHRGTSSWLWGMCSFSVRAAHMFAQGGTFEFNSV